MPGISVLVVDDHVLFADVLHAQLERESDLDPVSTAYHARDARTQVAAHHPAVVILDVLLGDSNGLDLVDEIKRLSPESRIVMLTAFESVDAVVTAFSRGASAWLPKTTDTAHLVRVIRGVCRGEAWLAPDLLGRVLADLTSGTVTQPNPVDRLTMGERDVLQCMVDGLSRAEIANRLQIPANTVRSRIQYLIAKLGVHSTLECVAVALRNGMRPSRH